MSDLGRIYAMDDIVSLPLGGIQPPQQPLLFTDFEEIPNAIDAGAAYVVVHTQAQPPGFRLLSFATSN